MSADKSSVLHMPASIVDAQLQRLLEIVAEYHQKQCDELLAQALLQSQNIIHHTYRSARSRLRNHILEDRQELQQSLASARAKQHTFVMQQKHLASRTFLDESWELLTQKLIKRWENSQQRELWIQNASAVAVKSLSAKSWSVVHGRVWSEQDKSRLLEFVSVRPEKEVTFAEDRNIVAGFRIEAGGAVVDATVQGLMADRVRIESEILAQCSNCVVEINSKKEIKS